MLLLLFEILALITYHNQLYSILLVIESFFMHSYTRTILKLINYPQILPYKDFIRCVNAFKYLQIIGNNKLNLVYK
ncbi:hypothetical protein FORC13_p186 (plasmid) [Bacillus cereus]|nr:hypothetical protein FORC13_p186 [Bacillus cereus]